MKEPSICANCKQKLKGVLIKNKVISTTHLAFINEFGKSDYAELCEKCVKAPLLRAIKKYKKLRKDLKPIVRDYIQAFPILSIELSLIHI